MPTVPFREAVAVWWRIGWLSFGGPAGQIALIHRVLVEEKRWLDEQRFLHALNYCMLLPGPEAQQLATYTGWLLHGVRGGLVAGLLFILPGATIMALLAWLYITVGQLDAVAGVFFGLKAAVLVIVVQAMTRLAGRALKGRLQWLLAGAGFTALFFFNLPFPLVVLLAGGIGLLAARWSAEPARLPDTAAAVHHSGTGAAAILCLVLWALTLVSLPLLLGSESVYSALTWFFSKLALVTFGGAYSVLAYVAQQAVEQLNWLQPGEMLDGLALAETTPGPLILVVEFVGFLAAWRQGLPDAPLLAGLLGAALTVWVTFLPCFAWIFAGAPHIEKLHRRPALAGALAAITAAVVGVMASLALWFAVNTLFRMSGRVQAFGLDMPWPDWSQPDLAMLALVAVAAVLQFRFRVGIGVLLGVCALVGIGLKLLILSPA